MDDKAKLKAIWEQDAVPVIVARYEDDLKVRVPYAPNNRWWLRGGEYNRQPQFVKDRRPYWRLPRSRFNNLIEACVERYGAVHVVQPYREKEVCAPACWNAKGFVCRCSCLGANHGAGDGGGFTEISDTFAVRWGEEHLGHKLVTRRRNSTAG